MFENFLNQPLLKLHEIVKKITRKNQCIVKKCFFNVLRESSAIKYALTMQPRFFTVDKMAVFYKTHLATLICIQVPSLHK